MANGDYILDICSVTLQKNPTLKFYPNQAKKPQQKL